jgi:hypothetical protein
MRRRPDRRTTAATAASSNRGNLGKVKEAVTLKRGILTGISLSGEEIFSQIEVKSVRTSGVLTRGVALGLRHFPDIYAG